jgi:hypothetical protein
MGQHAHVGKALQRIANKLPHFGGPTIHFAEFEAPFGYSTLQEKQMALLAHLPGVGAIRAVSLIDHQETWSKDTPFFNLLLMLVNKWDPLPQGIGEGTCDNVRNFLGLRESEKLYALTTDPSESDHRMAALWDALQLEKQISEKCVKAIQEATETIHKLKKQQGGKHGKKQQAHQSKTTVRRTRSRSTTQQPARRTRAVAKR